MSLEHETIADAKQKCLEELAEKHEESVAREHEPKAQEKFAAMPGVPLDKKDGENEDTTTTTTATAAASPHKDDGAIHNKEPEPRWYQPWTWSGEKQGEHAAMENGLTKDDHQQSSTTETTLENTEDTDNHSKYNTNHTGEKVTKVIIKPQPWDWNWTGKKVPIPTTTHATGDGDGESTTTTTTEADDENYGNFEKNIPIEDSTPAASWIPQVFPNQKQGKQKKGKQQTHGGMLERDTGMEKFPNTKSTSSYKTATTSDKPIIFEMQQQGGEQGDGGDAKNGKISDLDDLFASATVLAVLSTKTKKTGDNSSSTYLADAKHSLGIGEKTDKEHLGIKKPSYTEQAKEMLGMDTSTTTTTPLSFTGIDGGGTFATSQAVEKKESDQDKEGLLSKMKHSLGMGNESTKKAAEHLPPPPPPPSSPTKGKGGDTMLSRFKHSLGLDKSNTNRKDDVDDAWLAEFNQTPGLVVPNAVVRNTIPGASTTTSNALSTPAGSTTAADETSKATARAQQNAKYTKHQVGLRLGEKDNGKHLEEYQEGERQRSSGVEHYWRIQKQKQSGGDAAAADDDDESPIGTAANGAGEAK